MEKSQVINLFLEDLRKRYDLALNASKEAADYATHEEAKAESKWDTQGLEASYLAAGQAEQVTELAKAIQSYEVYLMEASNPVNQVRAGAWVSVKRGQDRFEYFIAAHSGGMTIKSDSVTVVSVTPQSPIYRPMAGLRQGDSFKLPNGLGAVIQTLR